MSLLKAGNPALNEKTFESSSFSRELEGLDYDRMTLRGTAGKFGAMVVMLILTAGWAWLRVPESSSPMLWLGGSAVGALIIALILSFKKEWAPYLALGYAMLEGIVLGTLSVVVNALFATRYPGIAGQAVLLTIGVSIAMFGLYYFRVLRATPLLTKVVIFSTMGIAIFYVIDMVMHMFGAGVPFLHDSSPLSIGISLFVVAIASLRLILNFDMIEEGAASGAPKYFEWYGAFGLTVTIVWLYLEILTLLMKLANRR